MGRVVVERVIDKLLPDLSGTSSKAKRTSMVSNIYLKQLTFPSTQQLYFVLNSGLFYISLYIYLKLLIVKLKSVGHSAKNNINCEIALLHMDTHKHTHSLVFHAICKAKLCLEKFNILES